MSFAVVKFPNETDEQGEIVQEVPTSWLCKDNKSCKWPPERYVKIYINKQFPPESHWTEHPVEVEGFFDSLQEAHKRANNERPLDELSLGRGQREVKPIDYFSPAEEQEREVAERKKISRKKLVNEVDLEGINFHERFVENMTGQKIQGKHHKVDYCIKEVIDIDDNGLVTQITNVQDSKGSPTSDAEKQKYLSFTYNEEESKSSDENSANGNNIQVGVNVNRTECLTTDSDKGSFVGVSASFSTLHSGGTLSMADSVAELHQKLDSILSCLSSLKMDFVDFKERHNCEKLEVKESITFPIQFPMKSLYEVEELDSFLKEKADRTTHFAATLKAIGGYDFKDFTHRLCRYLFTNSLAVLCSWTGRKNNFPIEKLEGTKIMYEVVHQKSKISKKDFENVMMEWFRHARQRKQREDKKDK